MAILGKNSLKTKKALAFLLFVLYLGSIALMAQMTPRTYVAQNTIQSIVIDGTMNELSWEKTPWSANFQDIEGEKGAQYQTKFKMLWDSTNLYFFVALKEPHVWATLKQKDTIVFYNNDFEIFIDPDGDTHNYYEFEVNALNTIWDLFLSKPYRNNGYILNDWDFKGLKSAVKIHGTLNDASDVDVGWNIEIAMPWSFTTTPGGTTQVPENDFWRINFSRVNWDYDLANKTYHRKKDAAGNYLPEHNWVWSPQGVVNMHEPEHWGYVYFAKNSSEVLPTFIIPEDEHIKWYLYELYRNLKSKEMGYNGWNLKNGQLKKDAKIILGKSIAPILEKNKFGFDIWVKSPFSNKTLVLHNDGKFEIYTDETN